MILLKYLAPIAVTSTVAASALYYSAEWKNDVRSGATVAPSGTVSPTPTPTATPTATPRPTVTVAPKPTTAPLSRPKATAVPKAVTPKVTAPVQPRAVTPATPVVINCSSPAKCPTWQDETTAGEYLQPSADPMDIEVELPDGPPLGNSFN